jgi:trehalose 6-phosphate phosphatase
VELPPPLAELASRPGEAAILLDIDGTLAPIVDDPAQSSVPMETRAVLRDLIGRYALVACLTGRPQEVARRIVGMDELPIIGEHGLELSPEAEQWIPVLARFAVDERWPAEAKRLTVAFHYRTAEDEAEAVRVLSVIAEEAEREGLVARWGRKVLELRPPIDANKGTGVVHLLEGRGLRRGMFAGDDLTDLDGFGAMEQLDHGVKVAVASVEGPAELRHRADVVVADPAELRELLRLL